MPKYSTVCRARLWAGATAIRTIRRTGAGAPRSWSSGAMTAASPGSWSRLARPARAASGCRSRFARRRALHPRARRPHPRRRRFARALHQAAPPDRRLSRRLYVEVDAHPLRLLLPRAARQRISADRQRAPFDRRRAGHRGREGRSPHRATDPAAARRHRFVRISLRQAWPIPATCPACRRKAPRR